MGLRMVCKTTSTSLEMKIGGYDLDSYIDGLEWALSVIKARKEVPLRVELRKAIADSPTLEVLVQFKSKVEEG